MNRTLPVALAVIALIGGCATTPKPNAALEQARTAVQTAEADPKVAKYAALDLEAAKNNLRLAESANAHHDEKAIDQPAYMATQTARLAELHAAAQADDEHIASGQAERDRIQLQARTREAENEKIKADALKAEVAALQAKQTDRGLVLTLGDVLFDTGKAELTAGGTRKLDQLAQFLIEHPDRRVEIDGFTDSIGPDGYNLDLSERRADAVRAALVARRVDPSRIGTQGYGKSYPVASNSNASGRQLNRRVEVIIGDDNGAAITARRP